LRGAALAADRSNDAVFAHALSIINL